MSERNLGLWAIRRGAVSLALELPGDPRVVPGEQVWWTRGDAEHVGVISGHARPIAVKDAIWDLGLPACPLPAGPWVLAAEDVEPPMALASDVEPVRLSDVEDAALPRLPSDRARRKISRAVASAETLYLVVTPEALAEGAVIAGGGELSGERVAARLARLSVEMGQQEIRPEVLTARSGGLRWGVPADDVQMVVRVDHITLLPGARRIVRGLSAITGRVTLIVDPARELAESSAPLPCWVAQVRSSRQYWGIAAGGEWEALSADDVEPVDDHTAPPGPPGLVVRRLRCGEEIVHVLSVDKLAELAGGRLAGDET